MTRSDSSSLLDGVTLAQVRGVGCVRFRELLAQHGSASAALGTVSRAERVRATEAAERILARMAELGGRTLVLGTDDYPAPLLDLADPPPVLYALGDLALLDRTVVAMVGTRRATTHGTRAARGLAEAVGRAGGVVASGLALGVDAAAHTGALDADAGTVAVLGTGVDVVYPRANARLYAVIRERGLLLSEIAPGDPADAGSFPRRNRIIAAIASVTVVVEAPFRSGALITADQALELGRSVGAVPGPIDVDACAGSNQLLRDGAQVVCGTDDLLTLAGLQRARAAAPTLPPPADAAERLVWEALAGGGADTDTLVATTRLPTARCVAALSRLELDGRVECLLTGQVVRRA